MKVNHRFVEKVDPIEEKKRLLLRKEMKEAYRKNRDFLYARNKINQLFQHLLENPEETNEKPKAEEVSKEYFQLLSYTPFSQIPLAQNAKTKKMVEGNRLFKNFQQSKGQKVSFNKILESPIFKKRMYQKAINTYTFQMNLAQNQFRLYEPIFSQTA
ncbi:hypothetical protein [Ureibacillus thermophilus]|uniref:Uncharacterized protein n=1 Tax=Ureibacillus thermophilus TaxID=367743 RepID=A0A4P6UQ90_9BACL|nr:hypothetical protein [Ureibacillus thermophilus]QBK25134.1 hypothetical protein DKZ56_04240 [Ureibacillus thermophilus]